MEKNHKSTRPMPSWPVSLMILLGICLLSNLLSALLQLGAFQFWRSLPGLPSPAAQILDIDPDNVWIQTVDGRIFTATIFCSGDDPCRQWIPVADVSEIRPLQFMDPIRRPGCENIAGLFPRDPIGKVMECVETVRPPMPEGGGFRTYFALMSDGTVKYWQGSNGHFLSLILCTGFATLVCPLIGFPIVVYLYSKIKPGTG